MRKTHSSWPEIREFINGLNEESQRRYDSVAAFSRQTHPLYDRLRRCRMSMFHYPEMIPARDDRGIEDLSNAMRAAAGMESTIESGEDYASFRALFADEVAVQFLAPMTDEAEYIFEALQEPMADVVRLGEAVLLAHLTRIDREKSGRIEVELLDRKPR